MARTWKLDRCGKVTAAHGCASFKRENVLEGLEWHTLGRAGKAASYERV